MLRIKDQLISVIESVCARIRAILSWILLLRLSASCFNVFTIFFTDSLEKESYEHTESPNETLEDSKVNCDASSSKGDIRDLFSKDKSDDPLDALRMNRFCPFHGLALPPVHGRFFRDSLVHLEFAWENESKDMYESSVTEEKDDVITDPCGLVRDCRRKWISPSSGIGKIQMLSQMDDGDAHHHLGIVLSEMCLCSEDVG